MQGMRCQMQYAGADCEGKYARVGAATTTAVDDGNLLVAGMLLEWCEIHSWCFGTSASFTLPRQCHRIDITSTAQNILAVAWKP